MGHKPSMGDKNLTPHATHDITGGGHQNLHFDAKGVEEIGKRFAAALLERF